MGGILGVFFKFLLDLFFYDDVNLGVFFSCCVALVGILFLASLGGETMLVELYKSFIVKKKPGKFKAKKAGFKSWSRKRKVFILPYLFTWLVFIFLLIDL